ncbi:hypothetical protein T261_8014 [Streptomyces lydicus]|nr:hypothetical protein T261_8014 [Streptomyces lydicus]
MLSFRTDGTPLTATGTGWPGRVGFVDAEDIAAVAVHPLTDVPVPTPISFSPDPWRSATTASPRDL